MLKIMKLLVSRYRYVNCDWIEHLTKPRHTYLKETLCSPTMPLSVFLSRHCVALLRQDGARARTHTQSLPWSCSCLFLFISCVSAKSSPVLHWAEAQPTCLYHTCSLCSQKNQASNWSSLNENIFISLSVLRRWLCMGGGGGVIRSLDSLTGHLVALNSLYTHNQQSVPQPPPLDRVGGLSQKLQSLYPCSPCNRPVTTVQCVPLSPSNRCCAPCC